MKLLTARWEDQKLADEADCESAISDRNKEEVLVSSPVVNERVHACFCTVWIGIKCLFLKFYLYFFATMDLFVCIPEGSLYLLFSISPHHIRETADYRDGFKKQLQVKGKICIFDFEVSRPFNNWVWMEAVGDALSV